MTRSLTAICVALAAGTSLAQDTIIVPDDVASLQDALDPAISGIDPGDTIVLRDSLTHFGTFLVTVPDVTIQAAAGDSPVLDANGAGSVIRVDIGNTGDLFLDGLTIQDGGGVGNSDRGSGIEVDEALRIRVRNCVIRDNNSDSDGGGMFGENVSFVIVDSLFLDNTASRDGGAIRNTGDSPVTIRSTQFIDNTASRDGGAVLYNGNGDRLVQIEDSVFEGNAANDRGGAIHVQNADEFVVDRTTFTANTAIGKNGSDAGAIFMDTIEDGSIADSEFVGNLANGEGGAILSLLDTGGGNSVEYVNTRFEGNEASSSTVALFGGTCDFVNCEFVNNTSLRAGDGSEDGGAIRYRTTPGGQRALGSIFNSVFDGNVADRGGAIALGTATVSITNSTFVNNAALGIGDAVAGLASATDVTIVNNVFADNGTDPVELTGGTRVTRFNLFDVNDTIEGDESDNLFGVNPLFVEASTGDYTLQAGSPAIDAGNSDLYGFGPFADLAGNLRGQDDPDTADTGVARTGPVIDMGAFEFNVNSGVAECPADQNFDGQLTPADFTAWVINFNAGCD
ncbi:MAG: right-handed parallel beta-helix repeat-containing protein [Planctomycetota bacterium]